MNGHGGKRAGAGRPAGALGRVTADIRALAQPYAASAVAELARLAGLTDAPGAANEATRVAALRELLDRAYGRSVAVLAGDEERGPIHYSFEWAAAAPSAAVPAVIDGDARSDAPLTEHVEPGVRIVWDSAC